MLHLPINLWIHLGFWASYFFFGAEASIKCPEANTGSPVNYTPSIKNTMPSCWGRQAVAGAILDILHTPLINKHQVVLPSSKWMHYMTNCHSQNNTGYRFFCQIFGSYISVLPNLELSCHECGVFCNKCQSSTECIHCANIDFVVLEEGECQI